LAAETFSANNLAVALLFFVAATVLAGKAFLLGAALVAFAVLAVVVVFAAAATLVALVVVAFLAAAPFLAVAAVFVATIFVGLTVVAFFAPATFLAGLDGADVLADVFVILATLVVLEGLFVDDLADGTFLTGVFIADFADLAAALLTGIFFFGAIKIVSLSHSTQRTLGAMNQNGRETNKYGCHSFIEQLNSV